MITNALNLVRAAAEPETNYNFRDLAIGLKNLPKRMYHRTRDTGPDTSVYLRFLGADNDKEFVSRYGYALISFAVDVWPQGDELSHGCAILEVRLFNNKLEFWSHKPKIGSEWEHVRYNKTFTRPAILTARPLLVLLDSELKRTNYYENFARWAFGLGPIPVLK